MSVVRSSRAVARVVVMPLIRSESMLSSAMVIL